MKWQKTYGGEYGDVATAVAIAPNGDIIVAGLTYSFGAGYYGNVWILRLPPDGVLPGCNFCSDSNAQVSNTDASMENTDATVENTHVTPQPSDATVKPANLEVETQYSYPERAKSVLDKAKSTISEYKSEGIILTPAENLLNEAEKAFNSGDYEKAYDYASQAIQKAEEIKSQYERAKPEVEKAKKLASEAGLTVNPLLSVFNSGDYERAYKMAIDAQKAVEAIKTAEGFLSPIGDARKAFEKGDYVRAYQLAIEAEKKRDLYQKLFALGVALAVAVTGSSAYVTHRKRRERERKLGELNALLRKAEKAPLLERIKILKEAEKIAVTLGSDALPRVRKLLSSAVNEATETYQGIINDFTSALENLDVKTAEAKLEEAKAYAEALGKAKDIEERKKLLERMKKERRSLMKAEKLVENGNLAEAARLLVPLQSSPISGIREGAKQLLERIERQMEETVARGDSLLASGDYTGTIRTYESVLPIAEALGKGEFLRSKIEGSRRTLDELKKRESLKKILGEITSAVSRRDYSPLGELLKEAEKLAKEIGEEGKVKALREELSTRLDNLLSRGEELELGGDYAGALSAYTEALSLAEALGRKTNRIKKAISRIEEEQKRGLLKRSIKLDVPTEMPHKAETEVSIIVTNRFSSDLALTVDLSENRDYFELSEEKIEFPRVKPGKTIGESVTVKPKFIGDFDFTVKIDSNFGSIESRIPVKVTKTARMAGGTPTPVTSTPILNPVEALQELYSDFQYIGEGGFARVYKAKRKDGKVVALKLPKTLDPAVGKAFIREITNWLHLKHPNIVELYDVNVLPVPYLEMEYCESSLARLQKPLPVDEAALIVFNIAEGLKYAHSKGIIHRDLKPSNVLLKNGLPKISNWGLSKVLEESMSATTTASFTPFYAAPEQIDRKYGRTDERTDIWQLGVIFYELVTGRLPFEGSLSQVMMGILRDEPIPPSQLNPEAKKVEPIIMKMLAKRKEERYQSIDELQKDLARILNMTYSESLRESKTLGDVRRATYYLTELLLINMKTNNIGEAYKYASDLRFYAKGELKEGVEKLAEQLKLRLEEGLKIPPELIEKAEIIVHKIRVGMTKP
ncbi:protein kinase [Thermococcus sp.]|uniref:serine/threonine-protein kinase n=1 Tax=Thermococcus sp. TaxID=35749 RepID=UPI0025D240A9|nr:protein kinase [Thermococcus sp.]